MKKIGFIGAYDKTDLIMYLAKILASMDKKVLVVDTTTNQKAKYIVPTISPSTSYITCYEDIDVSVGLYSFQDISNYLGIQKFELSGYDYVLLDVDNPDMVDAFDMLTSDKNYFVTSFDLYSLKRGIEVLSGIKETMPLTKVLFSKFMTKEEDDYLNYLSLGQKIQWAEERIYFPFDNGDQSVIVENQRISKIKLKGLSEEYRESLIYMVGEITEEKEGLIRKTFKQLEKDF